VHLLVFVVVIGHREVLGTCKRSFISLSTLGHFPPSHRYQPLSHINMSFQFFPSLYHIDIMSQERASMDTGLLEVGEAGVEVYT